MKDITYYVLFSKLIVIETERLKLDQNEDGRRTNNDERRKSWDKSRPSIQYNSTNCSNMFDIIDDKVVINNSYDKSRLWLTLLDNSSL